MLAERLSARSALHVAEARDGDIPEAGHVYLAPGDHHMRIVNRLHGAATRPTIALDRGERENSCRPAVDPLFRSLADLYGSRLLAVVLTGMGQDGMLGAGAIKKAGGHVIVQDEATSVIWGMPGSVVTAGSADAILPLADIPTQLLASTGGPLARLAAVFGTS
jgi:two-component system chemotaxis response regulator CheB